MFLGCKSREENGPSSLQVHIVAAVFDALRSFRPWGHFFTSGADESLGEGYVCKFPYIPLSPPSSDIFSGSWSLKSELSYQFRVRVFGIGDRDEVASYHYVIR